MSEVTFGEWLKRQRNTKGLTQVELALQINCSTSMLKKIESEQRRPSKQVVDGLAEVFQIPTDERESFLKFARGDWKAMPAKEEDAPWRVSHPSKKKHNLPIQLTSFVGREKELRDIKRLLKDTRLLTMLGPGGTGKTRLSVQAANDMLDEYPDGIWFVDLAPISDPLLVPRTTAMTIGLRDEPRHRSIMDMLCDYLGRKKMLIILDNCEHLVDACAQLADRILHAAQDVYILASSREALGIPGEVTYHVLSLDLPDIDHLPSLEVLSQYEAVRLFIDRAASAVPTFRVTNENAPALAKICYRLDGIPLAIELAAVKIRVLGLEQIAERLDDRFRLLRSGSRTVQERHQTLQSTVDWSYNLLPEEEQVLFRRLAVFVGGWTLEAVEFVCEDDSGSNVLDLLERLINKSLVITEKEPGVSRYHMLETIRQYANEKLIESNEIEVLRDKHLEFFLNLVEAASPHLIRPEQLEWLVLLDADYENLRAALTCALGKDSAEPSLRICAALGKFWQMHSYLIEGTKWIKRSLSKPINRSSLNERNFRIRTLYCHAQLTEEIDDIQTCKISAEASLSLCVSETSPLDYSIAKFVVGLAYFRHSDYKKARSYFEECLNQFRELGHPYWETNAQRWFSATLLHTGEKGYGSWIANNLIKARTSGERLSLAEALFYQTNKAWIYGQFDEARRYIKEAESLYNQLSYTSNDLALFSGLIEQINGRYLNAKKIFNNIIEQQELTGSIHTKSTAIQYLGSIAREEQNLDQARLYIQEALNIARDFGFISIAGVRYALLGQINYLQSNLELAKQNFKESITIAKRVDNRYSKTNSLFIFSNTFVNLYPEHIAQILGALHNYFETKLQEPIDPLIRRESNITMTAARNLLGNTAFKNDYKVGQRMSLDDALDLVLKIAEEL